MGTAKNMYFKIRLIKSKEKETREKISKTLQENPTCQFLF